MNLLRPSEKKNNSSRARSSSSTRLLDRQTQNLKKRVIDRRRFTRTPSVFVRKYRSAFRLTPYLFLIGMVIYGIYYFLQVSSYFKITNVNVSGTRKYVNETDLRNIVYENALGVSFFSVDTKRLSESLEKNFLGAKEVFVSKKLPNSLVIDVRERIPLAIIYNNAQKDFYLIDSDGYVLGVVDDEAMSLPRIRYDQQILIGKFVEKEIAPISSEIIHQAGYKNLKVSSMSFYPRYTDIFINDAVEVKVANDKPISTAIEAVYAMLNLSSSNPESKRIKIIDLRYNKVIVSY